MSDNGFYTESQQPVSENGLNLLVIGKCDYEPDFPVDRYTATNIYSDAIEGVDLSALLTQGKETGVPTGK